MRKLLFSPLVFVLGWACQSSADVSFDEGKVLFSDYCSKCHGDDAKGGGQAAAHLKTEPADLTRIAARRDGIWPMLEVMSIIDGYTKSTNPREDMPVVSELSEGPMVEFDTGNGLVTPIPARLIALARYLESVQSPKPKRYVP
ncbi:c-type cytochrome [Tropicimonas marinistellae]|uniref:c-type cytochrome n=1 Tax=Tropicimonas marinistellae TaxID=1739787 RepID=UPI0008313625|nr:c-type cytochrome [Tropicimonas marinistellae]